MRLIVVDYSGQYYAEKGEPLPARRSGKFVQIRQEKREYLILSPKELTAYHTDIVERFCSEERLACSFDEVRHCLLINDDSWTIVGGGKFDWDTTRQYLRLYDISTAYGPFDTKGLTEKIGTVEGLEAYRLLTG